jgi:hypothetical protein
MLPDAAVMSEQALPAVILHPASIASDRVVLCAKFVGSRMAPSVSRVGGPDRERFMPLCAIDLRSMVGTQRGCGSGILPPQCPPCANSPLINLAHSKPVRCQQRETATIKQTV